MKQSAWKGHAAMLSANVMWGLMAPLAKFVMITGIITPLIVTNLRIFGAAVLFWIVSLFQKPEHVPGADLLRLFGAALLAIVFNQGCFIFGVGLTSPADASIITTSMPLWAMVFAAIILKEPVTARKVTGILAGATGAILLILGGRAGSENISGGSNAILGDLLVLTAQCSYAIYLVVYKNFVSRYSLITIMKWMFTFASLCVVPFSAGRLAATDWQALSGEHIGAIVFIVVGATFLSYILILVGQRALRPTVVGMYNYIQPIVACLVAVAWGMSSFNMMKYAAVALIFGGVYLVNTSQARQA
ncbi:MAG: DMT family transporter [Muribaculaceae bacterium]|nr:DMT family transporter [Muribaculaceae bacterium]